MITLDTPLCVTVKTARMVEFGFVGAPVGQTAEASGLWNECDSDGNLPPTSSPFLVTLSAVDIDAFCATWTASRANGAAGNLQGAMDAALISNQPTLAGAVTT